MAISLPNLQCLSYQRRCYDPTHLKSCCKALACSATRTTEAAWGGVLEAFFPSLFLRLCAALLHSTALFESSECSVHLGPSRTTSLSGRGLRRKLQTGLHPPCAESRGVAAPEAEAALRQLRGGLYSTTWPKRAELEGRPGFRERCIGHVKLCCRSS